MPTWHGRLAILLLERVADLAFIGPWEVLTMAARLVADAWGGLVAQQVGPVHANYGLSMDPDWDFDSCPPLDLILVPGGKETRTKVEKSALFAFVRGKDAHCSWPISGCAGAFMLERSALLAGRRATTDWASLDQLRGPGTVDAAGLSPLQAFLRGIDAGLWLVQ